MRWAALGNDYAPLESGRSTWAVSASPTPRAMPLVHRRPIGAWLGAIGGRIDCAISGDRLRHLRQKGEVALVDGVTGAAELIRQPKP